MSIYTTRITNNEGKITAWVDRDGKVCIGQPHAPGMPEGSNWNSEEEALAWANEHAAELEAMNQKANAVQAQQNELIEQAKADSAKLTEIHEMLTKLTAVN
jgi:hypothetical protein